MTTQTSGNFDKVTIAVSMVIVSAISWFFLTNTETAIGVAGDIFTLIASNLGTPILWYAFGLVIIGAFFCFSKYGSIRMGNEKPEFSTFAYITMMALAGVGSGTVYWAFLEWSYYIKTPPFAIEAGSTLAHEWAVTYSLHHWGITAWAIYAITAIPVMYAFYIRKSGSLKISDIVKNMMGNSSSGSVVARIIDITYPIALVFGLIIVLSLGVPIISAAVSLLTGIADTLALKLGMVAIVAALLIMSSFLGIEKGMQNISSYGTYCIVALAVYILIMGPTQFILENTSSSIAIWASNFVKMSLYTDAIEKAGFPQNWTAYFWAYWMIFIPLMCVFTTKVSKGRTIREVIVCMIGGGTAGIAALFSIVGSFMMKTQLDGKVNISQMVSDGQASQSIVQSLNTLPLSSIILCLFIVATFLLLVTTLDGSVFTVACQTQKKLNKNNNPATALKIFWCLVIVAIPAVFISVNAPVGSMQAAILIFALPLLLLTSYMLYKTFVYMREDYGHMTSMEIENMHKLTDTAVETAEGEEPLKEAVAA
ncbi:BCCT family transporter [Sansalvadorimonas sp. 2012CJ34-2]|uniref:BCCT family transporter n=1 Tax=Parendozoicomonas callyspongiae TaxID=2942213 RepID=A0ABT0PB47_9GAMM|nr:BCCT family transporter [Sansalvadorimonas sp. 2012CJ34-2]MCL6268595.1 BCCT family transporter [Sansalvadorimonas sp. 2012CJ34-2]